MEVSSKPTWAGGAFFPASVTRIVGNSYDVLFFDGDEDKGLGRSMPKLVKPPVMEENVDTSAMADSKAVETMEKGTKEEELVETATSDDKQAHSIT